MGYIYQIVDTTTHEYYIGKKCNTNPETDNYWGSGLNRVCRSAKKHNGANGRYRKDILINGVYDEKLGKLEEILIGDRYETDKYCLNRKAGGMGGSVKGRVVSQKTKDLIGAAKKGVPKSDEDKANISAALKGNKSNLGKVLSQKTKDKMSAALKGNTNSLGIIRTAEQNAAKSAAMKEYWRLRKLRENNK